MLLGSANRDPANDLIEQLRRKPELSELTVSPLLLTMIVSAHRH